jgi:hypothetical protein
MAITWNQPVQPVSSGGSSSGGIKWNNPPPAKETGETALGTSQAALSHSQSMMDKIGGGIKDFSIGVTKDLIRTGNDFSNMGQNVAEGATNTAIGGINAVAGTHIPTVNAQPELAQNTKQIGDLTKSDNPMQAFGQTASQVAQFAAPVVEGAKLGYAAIKAAPEAARIIPAAYDALKSGELFSNGLKGARGIVQDYAEKRAAKQANSYALKITAPRLTPTEAGGTIAKNNFQDQGILAKGKALPTPHDNLVAESVADVVQPKGSLSENVDAISQKISQTNLGAREMIAQRNAPLDVNKLDSYFAKAKEDSKLIFASDPTAERTYDAVIDAFRRNIASPDTMGVFDGRQSFDQLPAIQKLLNTEGMGENVRREVVLGVRNAANQYIADALPANNPYRKAMQAESRMIEALGNIGANNQKVIGSNKIQLLLKEYPILKWVIGAGIGTAAGSEGVNLFHKAF